jgi:hypothetical protein
MKQGLPSITEFPEMLDNDCQMHLKREMSKGTNIPVSKKKLPSKI